MAEPRDEDIAKRVQDGDAESFGILVERYEGKMMRYGRKFLSTTEDIKDLVQDIFLKAYTNIRSFDVTRAFSPWLYRIAHNMFINAIKRERLRPLSFFGFDLFFPHPFAAETADRTAETREMKGMLGAALERLDAKYREVLTLYYFEELDYYAIADVLRIPVATVGVRLRRARMLLRDIYNNDHK